MKAQKKTQQQQPHRSYNPHSFDSSSSDSMDVKPSFDLTRTYLSPFGSEPSYPGGLEHLWREVPEQCKHLITPQDVPDTTRLRGYFTVCELISLKKILLQRLQNSFCSSGFIFKRSSPSATLTTAEAAAYAAQQAENIVSMNNNISSGVGGTANQVKEALDLLSNDQHLLTEEEPSQEHFSDSQEQESDWPMTQEDFSAQGTTTTTTTSTTTTTATIENNNNINSSNSSAGSGTILVSHHDSPYSPGLTIEEIAPQHHQQQHKQQPAGVRYSHSHNQQPQSQASQQNEPEHGDWAMTLENEDIHANHNSLSSVASSSTTDLTSNGSPYSPVLTIDERPQCALNEQESSLSNTSESLNQQQSTWTIAQPDSNLNNTSNINVTIVDNNNNSSSSGSSSTTETPQGSPLSPLTFEGQQEKQQNYQSISLPIQQQQQYERQQLALLQQQQQQPRRHLPPLTPMPIPFDNDHNLTVTRIPAGVANIPPYRTPTLVFKLLQIGPYKFRSFSDQNPNRLKVLFNGQRIQYECQLPNCDRSGGLFRKVLTFEIDFKQIYFLSFGVNTMELRVNGVPTLNVSYAPLTDDETTNQIPLTAEDRILLADVHTNALKLNPRHYLNFINERLVQQLESQCREHPRLCHLFDDRHYERFER